ASGEITPDPREPNQPIEETSNEVVTHKAPAPTIEKSVVSPASGEVRKGDKVTYRLVVTNGDAKTGTLTVGTVTDSLPSGLVHVANTTTIDGKVVAESSWNGENLTVTLPDPMLGGATATIEFQVTVETDFIGVIPNTAVVAGKDINGNGNPTTGKDYTDNDTADITTVRKPGALSLEKSVDVGNQSVVGVDEVIEYTLIVKNTVADPSEVREVTITDAIPEGLIYQPGSLAVDGTAYPDSHIQGQNLSINVGTLLENETKTITFKVKVTATAKGEITNIADVTGKVTYPDGTEGDSTDDDEVLNYKQPEPKIEKDVLTKDGQVAGATEQVTNGNRFKYQLVITNGQADTTGSLYNGTVTDKLPAGIKYVQNSTVVDGLPVSDSVAGWSGNELTYALPSEFKGGETITLVFEVEVEASAALGLIPNTAKVSGEDKSGTPDYKDEDTVEVEIVHGPGTLAVEKKVLDQAGSTDLHDTVIQVGETIRYSIIVKNTETAPSEVKNVVVTDQLPEGLDFVSGSVTVDGQLATGNVDGTNKLIVNTGKTLQENESLTVSFLVTVTDVSAVRSVNKGIASGEITPDPREPNQPIEETSNEVVTHKAPAPTIEKSVVSPASGEVRKGDKVTYRLVVTNGDAKTGTLTVGTVTDSLPSGLVHVANTTTIDGKVVAESSWNGENLTVTLPDPMLGGATATIEFQVTVETDFIGVIPNTAVVAGKDINGNGNPTTGKDYTDNDTADITTVRKPGALSLEKSVDVGNQSVVGVDEVIEYTLIVKNTVADPSEVREVTITDAIPEGLIYQAGSLAVDGTAYPDSHIQGQNLSINVGTLLENETKTITFKVKVTATAKGEITNIADVTGKVTYPDGTEGDSTDDDEVLNYRAPNPTIEKTVVTPANGIVMNGDEVTYRLVVTNGDANTGTMTNGVVTDSLPAGLKHVANTTTLNGSPVAESSWSGEALTAVLPTPMAGGATATIEFKVKVDTTTIGVIPNTAEVSGQDMNGQGNYTDDDTVDITTMKKPGSLALTKAVSKGTVDIDNKVVAVGDIITYTIVVKNIVAEPSEVKAITVKDVIPSGLIYQAGTLKVDGVSTPDSSVTGQDLSVEIGSLQENETREITFDVQVTADAKGSVVNVASAVGKVTDVNGNETPSNEVTDDVENHKQPEPKIEKDVLTKNGQVATATEQLAKGNTFTYQLVVTNGTASTTGTLYNGTVTDSLPAGLSYVPNTTKVDQVPVSDAAAVWNGNSFTYTLPAEFAGGAAKVITFEVEVLYAATVSELGIIKNNAEVTGEDRDGTTDYTDTDDADIDVVRGAGALNIQKAVLDEAGAIDLNDKIVQVDDVIRYTLVVTNTATEPSTVSNILVKDTIPAGLLYQTGSLEIDGQAVLNPNISGQNLEVALNKELTEGQSATISFLVKVTNASEVSSINQAVVTGAVTPDPREPVETLPEKPSNEVVVHRAPEPMIEKTIVSPTNGTTIKGGEVTYRLVVTNGGTNTGDLIDGVVTDALPVGLSHVPNTTMVNNQVIAESSWTGETLSVALPTPMKGGAAVTIEFKVRVETDTLGAIINIADVSGEDADGQTYTDDDSADITTVRTAGELALEKTVSKNGANIDNKIVSVGDIITYTVVVKNTITDPSEVRDVIVKDDIPVGLIYQKGSLKVDNQTRPDNLVSGQVLKVNVGNLLESQTSTITFDVEVTAAAKGALENIATAIGSVADLAGNWNPLDEIQDDVVNHKKPAPTIEKTVLDTAGNSRDDLPQVINGEEFEYQLIVRNGLDDATGSLHAGTVTDTLPTGLEYVQKSTKVDGVNVTDSKAGWSGNTLNYALPAEFKGGETITITFKVRVISDQLGTIRNTAKVSGTDSDAVTTYQDSDNAEVAVIRGPGELQITKEVKSADNTLDLHTQVVAVGTVIKYNLIVENITQELSEVKNVTVTDAIPEGLIFVPGTLTIDGNLASNSNISGQQLTLDIGTLQENSSKIISFDVTVTAASQGISTNIGHVEGKVPSYGETETSTPKIPSNEVTIYKPADPQITKSVVGNTKVKQGNDVTYRLVVTNGEAGTGNVYNGIVMDTLMEGLTYKAGTTKVNGELISDEVWSNNELTYPLPSPFAGGTKLTIEFTVTVNKVGDIPNLASVSGSDVNGTQHTDEDDVVITAVTTPDLSLEKSVKTANDTDFGKEADKTIGLNEEFEYRLVVRNNTIPGGKVINPRVVDQLPAGLVYVSGSTKVDGKEVTDELHWSDNTFTYSRAEMLAGEVWDIRFKVKATGIQHQQQIVNIANVTGQDELGNPVGSQDSVTVTGKEINTPVIPNPNPSNPGITLPNTGSTTLLPSTNTTGSASPTRRLPNTGEQETTVSMLGYLLLVSAVGMYLQGKNKKAVKK
ncbi:isopeptide-forming domain-containing fimbrial protein, partial [Enterococcus sp. LJL51]|uniref:isopeptide-forming domain-containing fimbrial protein n=1 Tax=Enterococcus sp. LJL51 TaxID=3416656 RepID=UPI003CEADE0C